MYFTKLIFHFLCSILSYQEIVEHKGTSKLKIIYLILETANVGTFIALCTLCTARL